MDAMNFSDNESGKVDYTPLKNQSVNVAQCQYFTTNFVAVNGELSKNYDSVESFVILMEMLVENALYNVVTKLFH